MGGQGPELVDAALIVVGPVLGDGHILIVRPRLEPGQVDGIAGERAVIATHVDPLDLGHRHDGPTGFVPFAPAQFRAEPIGRGDPVEAHLGGGGSGRQGELLRNIADRFRNHVQSDRALGGEGKLPSVRLHGAVIIVGADIQGQIRRKARLGPLHRDRFSAGRALLARAQVDQRLPGGHTLRRQQRVDPHGLAGIRAVLHGLRKAKDRRGDDQPPIDAVLEIHGIRKGPDHRIAI